MKTIKQVVIFEAEPHEVYEDFMDSKKHAEFTGEKAKISREIKGKIMAYDGYIVGKNIELVKITLEVCPSQSLAVHSCTIFLSSTNSIFFPTM